MIYFTSDLHLGHANIIRHCNRPFSSVEEMDETLIRNWAKRVKANDTVYVLGDLMFRNQKSPEEYEALMMLLKEAACDQYDYISWWLYEGAPDYRIWTQDEKKGWCLKDPGDLYDFIRDECQN